MAGEETGNVEVLMPLMGEGINEATLVKWLKKPGEKIAKAEPLLEVSTDKVDTEIPSPADGFLIATFAEAGATVAINSVIAHIGAKAGSPAKISKDVKTGAPVVTAKTVSPKAVPAAATLGGGVANAPGPLTASVRSSPLVRKMARDHSVNLSAVLGSGLNGRITKDDLLAYLTAQSDPSHSNGGGIQPLLSRVKTTLVDGQEFLEGVAVRREKMSKMRRLIAEHMVETARVAPHVTTVFEIDLHRIVALREREKSAFEAREGFKLTYTPFFIHAAVQAIKAHPIVNTSVDGDEVLHKEDINVGCAVALGSGLIVPVIKRAGDLSLVETARRLNDLVTRARSKKLMPEEVQGGTFSITNPGGFGSLTSNPLINQPQVAILGIGAIVKRPVVVEDKIEIRPMILISLTFDHRVIDGEGGANYLVTLKKILENHDGSLA